MHVWPDPFSLFALEGAGHETRYSSDHRLHSSISHLICTESVDPESSSANARQPRIDCQDERGAKILEEKS